MTSKQFLLSISYVWSEIVKVLLDCWTQSQQIKGKEVKPAQHFYAIEPASLHILFYLEKTRFWHLFAVNFFEQPHLVK